MNSRTKHSPNLDRAEGVLPTCIVLFENDTVDIETAEQQC